MATAYNWGGTLKAPLPIDRQVWFDDDMHAWQWSAAAQSWNRAPHIQLKRVYSRMHATYGRPVGSDFLAPNSSYAPKPGRLAAVFNSAYTLSFVEIVSASTGEVRGRRAHMDQTALMAWAETVIVMAGAQYDENILLNVYEAVDHSTSVPNWTVWNGLYGSFRGRDCYVGFNGYGRGSPTTSGVAGYSDDFSAYHHTNIEIPLIQEFYAKTPATSNPLVCWSTRSRHGMYHLPAVLTARVVAGGVRRDVWNDSTDSWEVATPGDVFMADSSLVPMTLWRNVDDGTLHIEHPTQALRGIMPIVGNANGEPREYMIVRAMRSESNGNLKALLFKPYGITKAAFHVDSATGGNKELLAVGHYDGNGANQMVVNLHGQGMVQNRDQQGWRFSLPPLYLAMKTMVTNPVNVTVDTPILPENIRFYLRDKLTGVRTPVSQQVLELRRRKASVPIAIQFRNG